MGEGGWENEGEEEEEEEEGLEVGFNTGEVQRESASSHACACACASTLTYVPRACATTECLRRHRHTYAHCSRTASPLLRPAALDCTASCTAHVKCACRPVLQAICALREEGGEGVEEEEEEDLLSSNE